MFLLARHSGAPPDDLRNGLDKLTLTVRATLQVQWCGSTVFLQRWFMIELGNWGGLDNFFSNDFLHWGVPLQSGDCRTKSRKRRCRSGLSVSSENIEPRVALTVIMPTTMPGMYQPPAVTGQISVDVNYQYLSPDLVFNGVGDRVEPGIVRYDSTVPFLVNGQTTGPADLKLTFPNGNVMQTRVDGVFSLQFPLSTAMSPTTAMTMQAQLFSAQTGNLISQFVKTEPLKSEKFRFEDYFGKIGQKADNLLVDQIHSQVDTLFNMLLTDEMLTEMALQRMGNDPTASLTLTIQQLRDDIDSAKGDAAGRLECGVLYALNAAVQGDQLDHHFEMGIGHPFVPEFGGAMAASKAAYNNDFSDLQIKDMFNFSVPLPSIAQLKSDFSHFNSQPDVASYFNSVPVGITLGGPSIQILDGVAFSASTSFNSTNLLTSTPNLSAYRVEAGINFSSPAGPPPILFGPKMQGHIGGFFERSRVGDLFEDQNSADSYDLGIKVRFKY